MDIFALRQQLIDDYRSFTGSFVAPRDARIRALLEQRQADGAQWPEPWLSLNPAFASGGSVDDLVAEGLLHPACARVFRVKRHQDDPGVDPIVFHRHQRDAIEAAASGRSYVLTTGTGSGKSLAYVVPIVDRILRSRVGDDGRGDGVGVKAVIVYPMNALANSQVEELRKFLEFGFARGERPVTFARYTGQEGPDERRRILAEPPDILLTNYVMLDLVLTRPDERRHLVTAARGLRFLVLDELHTYRGRQGADVAMLVRRVRDACESPSLQVVGTSATMASGGTRAEQRATVAGVASRLFGTEVSPEAVIGETLVATASERGAEAALLAEQVTAWAVSAPGTSIGGPGPAPTAWERLADDALVGWVETHFGLTGEEASGELIRRPPARVGDAAAELAGLTGHPVEVCREALERLLLAGSQAHHPVTGRPLFAFRLHQFVSKGDNVYASLGGEAERHLTDHFQLRVPDHPEQALLPLGFCRECGQEYYVAARVERDGQVLFVPRSDRDASGGDAITGYLYVSSDDPWPVDPASSDRLPDHWLVEGPDGELEVAANKAKYLPVGVWLAADGTVLDEGDGLRAWWMSTPFAFCLRCRVSYEQVRGNDFSKLATLDQEGRSSAMTTLSATTVRALRSQLGSDLPASARKVLTFVDNRQDASLQAGHFNDFAQVAQLRGALCSALAAHPGGLTHEKVAGAATDALGLSVADYAENPGAKFNAARDAEAALRAVVEYRLYADLKRGWRVTMPNLEQVGLLIVDYTDLADIAADEPTWRGRRPALVAAGADDREELLRITLDEMRRVLAVDVECLGQAGWERVQRVTRQHLRDPWTVADTEQPEQVGTAFARSGTPGTARSDLNLSGRTALGRYLRRAGKLGAGLSADEGTAVLADVLGALAAVGTLREVATDQGGRPGYRIKASAILWSPGDGARGADDPLRRATDRAKGSRVNPYFRDLYRTVGAGLAGLYAREHTAQVPSATREDRERDFRSGALPLLYCSPTMELGVDIASLSAVSMRNVPPTPANYAQRSGRAGRSGQPAMVTTYCASGNAHDNFWFRRSRDMVAGSVQPPRLDLGNEELVRSHVHAVWLAETGQSMRSSLPEVLDMAGDRPSLDILPDVWLALTDPEAARRATVAAERLVADLRSVWSAADDPVGWDEPGWTARTVERAALSLDRALDRWRDLYRAAKAEYDEQGKLAVAHGASKHAQERAAARQYDARQRLKLLANNSSEVAQSDFYSYRYLASEGFLPGYSFPRLPLAAYIPGARRGGRGADAGYLQRPRFIAIREFGPGSLIYHEGARYEVVSVQVPRDAEVGGLRTEDARRCEACGYHHSVGVGTDVCDLCGARLGAKTHGLLRLQTVTTRRRERISSDEEERRRSGFEVEVSYRFATHGDRPGRIDAAAHGGAAGGVPLLTLTYGDAATLRLANVGRRRRKDGDDRGFWLDPHDGRWLSDKQAADATVDGDDLASTADVAAKAKVIPYVEDTRNVLVVRAGRRLDATTATTLRYALERGIEARYQLEDSELDSTALPDSDSFGRMLFTEAAEGGAGVLRRLVADPAALSAVAVEALRLLHVDPASGEDLGHAEGVAERCELGCYDCLLSFSNQGEHGLIDRRSVTGALLDLAGSTTTAGAGGQSRTDLLSTLVALTDSSLERQWLHWIDRAHLRPPDRAQVTVDGARARPDFVYDLPSGERVAVFVDGPVHDSPSQAERDQAAAARLEDGGWQVIRFGYDSASWPAVASRHPAVFGGQAGGQGEAAAAG